MRANLNVLPAIKNSFGVFNSYRVKYYCRKNDLYDYYTSSDNKYNHVSW